MKILADNTNFQFVSRMRLFALLSGGAVLGSILLILVLGLNFGIDFAGGYEIQVQFQKATTEVEVKQALSSLQRGSIRVQRFGDESENSYLIMIREQGSATAGERASLRAGFERLAGEAKLARWSIAESGEQLIVGFNAAVDEGAVREVISSAGFEIKDLRRGDRDDKPEYVVGLVSLADDIEALLRSGLTVPEGEQLVQRTEFVGPQVGGELRNQGIMAMFYALLFILLYIGVRFDLAFAPGAVVALVHDVLITVGIFSLFQLEFNLPIIAALLALVGYSLNDTIVVYDRIRENGLRLRGRELRDLVNTSINQTLSRTLLTSGTTLLVVVALVVFGGGMIRDFSFALLVGVVVGTYSSVAIASPVYILLREYSAQKETPKRRSRVAAT